MIANLDMSGVLIVGLSLLCSKKYILCCTAPEMCQFVQKLVNYAQHYAHKIKALSRNEWINFWIPLFFYVIYMYMYVVLLNA